MHILIADADVARANSLQGSLEETGDDTVVLATPADLAMTLLRSKPDALILATEALDRRTIDELRVARARGMQRVLRLVLELF